MLPKRTNSHYLENTETNHLIFNASTRLIDGEMKDTLDI